MIDFYESSNLRQIHKFNVFTKLANTKLWKLGEQKQKLKEMRGIKKIKVI